MDFNMNWADVVVILVIAASCMLEYKRGFVKSIFKTFSFVIAIFVSWTVHPYVTEFLKNSFIYQWIKGGVGANLFKEAASGEIVSKEQQMEIIDKLSMPDFFKNLIKDSEGIKNNDILNFLDFKESIVNSVSNFCIGILAIIIVIIVTMVILRMTSTSLDIISKIPVIKEINEIFGFLLGLVIGVIEVWLSFIVMLLLFSTNQKMSFIFTEINNSVVAKLLYENNLLNYIIAGIFGK
ncbi:MAG TPA: hypothetical protein DEP72_00140 [Clostridiales bacterium]|nr:MAG: hypothetical protein A2Y18_08320 [Clostridiales bacterium GWD2_32_19]HCC06561.1 hypothetical protein [Clostridiales bacterium]